MAHVILNAEGVELPAEDANLLDWLRERGLTSAKPGCRGGDCGACQVLLGEVDTATSRPGYRNANSCLLTTDLVADSHVITVEGLNTDRLTPVQQSLVDAGAIQCGYCTPGMVVALTGALIAGEPPDAAVAGNLCRCTGYAAVRRANVSPTAASTGTDLNGAAAREACLAILANLPPGDRGQWRERLRDGYAQRRSLSALAHYATAGLAALDATTGQGTPFRYHVYGAALVEAEVDVLLGTGRIDRVTVVHDCGERLDELTDRGQIEGAIVQGIGWMTTEEIRHDREGRLLTDALATYKVPDLPDAPVIDVQLLDAPNPVGLLGSKAVGEPPLVYGLGAFFALQDAIAGHAPAAASTFTTP